LDLGLGSHQLSSEERGFSVELGGPLDMRYDPGAGVGAGEVVNRFPERELEKIFRELGEERRARAIAREIVNVRRRAEIKDALELSRIVKRVSARGTGNRKGRMRIHPATRTFMALRIFVNSELRNLESFLPFSISVLKEGGVIVVISFHSLEDRIVKTFFRKYSGRGGYEDQDQFGDVRGKPLVSPVISILTKKPITPAEEEINENRRARSAKLRAARRIGRED
jgi:16S rRNA (cytosine1402-N4)-methyltransferase